MPELSVIIPVFNRPESVVRAIDSVFAQGVDDLEVLVVDDASEPPLELPERLGTDARLRIVRHRSNGGAAAARNTGMREASGTWIAFLDSDDRWLSGTLAPRLAQAREAATSGAHPLTVHVAGFRYLRRPGERADIRVPLPASDPLAFASGCWSSPGSTALFLREPMLAQIGFQNERLRRFEDVDWFLRIALAGGGMLVSPIIAAELESGTRPPPATVRREGALLLAHFAEALDPALRKPLLRRLRAWLAFEQASAHWHAREYGLTAGYLWRSWWLAPRARLYLRKFWTEGAGAEDQPETL